MTHALDGKGPKGDGSRDAPSAAKRPKRMLRHGLARIAASGELFLALFRFWAW